MNTFIHHVMTLPAAVLVWWWFDFTNDKTTLDIALFYVAIA
jgi:hypothetical protein